MNIVAIVIAYLLGCISPAIILGKIYGIDIKKQGSGNAGTTNVLRVLGGKAAVITLLIDIAKGSIAVSLGNYLAGDKIGMICAFAVFCGHLWPCFYKFKGGKGVATSFGVILAVHPLLALMSLGCAAVLTVLSKRMSVGSLSAAVMFVPLCFWFKPEFIYVGSLMALIIIIKHRGNIKRLINKEEPPMSIFERKNGDKNGK